MILSAYSITGSIDNSFGIDTFVTPVIQNKIEKIIAQISD